MPPSNPRVFISYSHDSTQHKDLVLRFAERLRKDGIDAQIDQYVKGRPPGGWPRWMEYQLDSSEFVLVICTETYHQRFLGREEPDKGKGSDWEGSLITLELYRSRSDTNKFVPVLFHRQHEPFIPRPLSGNTHYLLSSEDNYADLYAFLTGRASIPPGALGALKTLAPRKVTPIAFGVGEVPELSADEPAWIDETERRTWFSYESAKESLNYPPLGSSVLLEVQESKSQALESFAKALGRQRGLVENAATPRLTVRFQFPFAASEEDFAKILIEPAPEKSVEVSHWLSPNENLDQLAFLALYPSGRVRTINARAVSKDRRTFVAFEDPICFLDPGSDERPRWPLQGYRGEIDLLALRLPPYET